VGGFFRGSWFWCVVRVFGVLCEDCVGWPGVGVVVSGDVERPGGGVFCVLFAEVVCVRI